MVIFLLDSPDDDNVGGPQNNLDSDEGQIVSQHQDLNDLSAIQGNKVKNCEPKSIQFVLKFRKYAILYYPCPTNDHPMASSKL